MENGESHQEETYEEAVARAGVIELPATSPPHRLVDAGPSSEGPR